MKKDTFAEIEHVFEDARQKMISLIDSSISTDYSSRRSTLSSNVLATVLANAALNTSSEKTTRWLELNAHGMNIVGFPTSFTELSPLMHACHMIVEEICGFRLPPEFKKKLPSVDEVAQQLDYPCYLDASYALPFHLACAALFCTIKGVAMPELLHLISDLQQKDGSWTDDVIATALSTLALLKGGVKPKYDVQKWLEREHLPDGSWAVANGEVWETSYALRTGQCSDTAALTALLVECVHPNNWWGYSRFAVPDVDDTAVACCALAPYEPHIASRACKKLLDVQHESGGWGAFPQIEGIVPHESVVGKPQSQVNDITCHVLEALEQNKKSGLIPFKRGISYLLETQKKDGHWETKWWNSDIYATAEIALLMCRNGYSDSAFHAMSWLEKKRDGSLNTVEYALLIMAFSELPDYSDSLDWVVHRFLEQYSLDSSTSTFNSVYFCGLIDCKIYNLSMIIASLHKLINLHHTLNSFP